MKNLLFCLLLVPGVLSAQTEKSDTVKTKADLALTGIYQDGNVETWIFRAKSEVSFKPWKKFSFKTTNSYVYQEFGKEKADEDILSLNFLNYNTDKKFYPLMLAFVSTNFRREIDLRYLLGAGITYQLLKTEDNWLRVSLSTEYEKTNFASSDFNRSEYDGTSSINTMRGTLWVNGKYKLFDKKVILTHQSYVQPSLERSNNFRWQADVGVEFPLSKHLNFKVNYLNTFESIVIGDQKQQDRFLTFGFTLKSYE